MIGQPLSHDRILSEISRVGMGIVYRAVDLKLDREVALKVLPPELVADPERKRRFVQEAIAAAKHEHPHIAVVYEIDEAAGTTFTGTERLKGQKVIDWFTGVGQRRRKKSLFSKERRIHHGRKNHAIELQVWCVREGL